MTETTVSAVRLSGRLPKGEANGLDSIKDDLIGDPAKIRYAVVTYDVDKITYVVEDKQRFPLVSIARFEPVVNPDHIAALTDALNEAFRERTGLDELPFDEDDEDAERMAAAAEEHLADNPDSVLSK